MRHTGLKALDVVSREFLVTKRSLHVRHLQGDLQAVFDALYDLGVIEPVLGMDWRARLVEIEKGSPQLDRAIVVVNECGHDRSRLATQLNTMDRDALEMLAMEVAREYADYHTRQADLH